MAILSSHILNSIDGTHAKGIKAKLQKLISKNKKLLVLETETDEGGRILENLKLNNQDCLCKFELVLQTGEYFSKQNISDWNKKIVNEIVIHFTMEDPNKKYHIPIMVSPNSYSVWWSE
tara:strand:- start:15 stop:371 length:357 start_codon:yes stop_codon:yes gene_type:complete